MSSLEYVDLAPQTYGQWLNFSLNMKEVQFSDH